MVWASPLDASQGFDARYAIERRDARTLRPPPSRPPRLVHALARDAQPHAPAIALASVSLIPHLCRARAPHKPPKPNPNPNPEAQAQPPNPKQPQPKPNPNPKPKPKPSPGAGFQTLSLSLTLTLTLTLSLTLTLTLTLTPHLTPTPPGSSAAERLRVNTPSHGGRAAGALRRAVRNQLSDYVTFVELSPSPSPSPSPHPHPHQGANQLSDYVTFVELSPSHLTLTLTLTLTLNRCATSSATT